MSLFKSAFAALALVFSSVAVVAPAATAQGTKVVVIDIQKIMRDSKAGKDIQAKLQAISKTMDGEIAPARTQYQSMDQAFGAKFEGMSQQEATAKVSADEALKQEYVSLLQMEQQVVQATQIATRDLRYTQGLAWQQFNQDLQVVLKEVVDETGAEVMLDRTNVTYFGPSVDVTASAIAKMDAKTPSINVVRKSPPQQQAPAQ